MPSSISQSQVKHVSLSQERESQAVLQLGKIIYLLAICYVFYKRSEQISRTLPLALKICVSMTTVMLQHDSGIYVATLKHALSVALS